MAKNKKKKGSKKTKKNWGGSRKSLGKQAAEAAAKEIKEPKKISAIKEQLKRSIFISEYLKDFNATRAAKAAGYSEKSAYELGSKLLKNVEIQDEIVKRVKTRVEYNTLERELIIQKLFTLHDRCMQAEAVVDKDGVETGEYKFDGKTAARALDLLGRHLGLFPTQLKNDPDNPIAGNTIVYVPDNGRD